MPRRQRLAYALCAGLLLHALPLHAQWAERFTKNAAPSPNNPYTAGWYLEEQFDPILSACAIPLPLRNPGFGAKARTSIPRTIQNYLGARLTMAVTSQITHSLPALYAYAFRDTLVSLDATGRYRFNEAVNPASSRLINMSLVRDPADFVPAGFSNLEHTQSCSSVIAQTLQAGAGLELGPAAIEAALRQEFNSASRTTLGIVEAASFASPLLTARNTGSDEDRAVANFLLWEWYHRNHPAAADKYYLLSTFNGIATISFLHQDRSFDAAARARIGAALPVASATGAVSGAYTQSASTTIQGYSTAAYMKTAQINGHNVLIPDVRWEPMPALADIVTQLSQRPAQLITETVQPVLIAGEANTHQTFLTGVPAQLCNSTYWEVSKAADTSEISLARIDTTRVSPEIPIQRCVFTVQYTPTSTNFDAAAKNARPLLLEYLLKTRSTAVQNVVIKVPSISFEVSGAPDLQSNPLNSTTFKDDPIMQGGQTTHQLQWTLAYDVAANPGDDLRWSVTPAPVDAKVTCGEVEYPVAVVPTLNPGNRQLKLAIALNVSEGGALDVSHTRSCNFTTGMRFTMANPPAKNRTVVKTLKPVTVSFPGPVQQR